MTTATEIRHSRELLSTEERDGRRIHRFKWQSEGGVDANGAPLAIRSGLDEASERVEPLALSILEDRWEGLAWPDGNSTELNDQLNSALYGLAAVLTRRGMEEQAFINGKVTGLDEVLDVDGLIGVIRDWLIVRAAAVAS